MKNTIAFEKASEMKAMITQLFWMARKLGIEKETGFLDKKRELITSMATEAKPPNPMKGVKGWTVPGGEAYQFKPGNISPMKNNPELRKKATQKRNETIKRDRLRRKYNLPPITKMKLNPYADPKVNRITEADPECDQ